MVKGFALGVIGAIGIAFIADWIDEKIRINRIKEFDTMASENDRQHTKEG